MNRSRLTVIAALVAVLAIAAGVVAFTTRGSDTGSTRQRNAALDNKLDTSFGTNGYSLVYDNNMPFTAIDSATTGDGTTYVVGTVLIKGMRHALVRSTTDGKTTVSNFVIPSNDYQLERGTWKQPLKETVPIALSVDTAGSVWVLADGYHSTGEQKTPFITQLKKSDLTYYSDCGSLCGIAFASWSTLTDIAVNPAGDRLLVVSSQETTGFKPTTGKDLLMAYGISNAVSKTTCANSSAATNVVAMSDRFYTVNSLSSPKTAIRLTFTDVPTAVECTDKLPLLTISDITTDADGTLYAYGKGTANTVGFWRMQAGAMDAGTGMGSLSPKMIDETTKDVFPGGITASSGTLHMAASVNSLNGPKTILEYVVRNNSLNISTAIDSVSTEVIATTPPLLTRHGSTLTLIAPTSYSGVAASLIARFNATQPLVGAPEWPVSQQTLSLNYGSTRGLNFAKPTQVSTYSIESGSLPMGLTLHSSLGLRGSPQEVGTFTARIKAMNSGGASTSNLTLQVSAVAPTEGSVTGWKQVDGNVIIDYIPGLFGSNSDVISAGATDPSGTTVLAECKSGQCTYPDGNLDEGVAYDVRIRHRNDVGEALSANSISVTPLGRAQRVGDVSVVPGLREATVSFTEPTSSEGLTVSRYDISIIDKETNEVVSAIGCDASPCDIDIDAPNSQRKYVANVTAIYNDAYSMSSATSSEFSVKTPKSIIKFEFNSDMNYNVAARQYFVIPLMARGTDSANISASPEIGYVRFKSNPARLEGELNPGTYEIPVIAETENGTVTSVARIIVAPGKLPAPELTFNFNTYDGKLSATTSMEGILADAITALKWKAQVNNTVITGECSPYSLCDLNGIPFDSEISFRVQAVSDTEEASDWVDMTVFTPSQEKPVAIDTASFTLQQSDPEVGIVEFAVRTSLPRKFTVELQANATIQLNAETYCTMYYDGESTTYRQEAVDSCPVDPYARLFEGETLLASDDDGGSFPIYDPTALQDEEDPQPIGVMNQFSPRLSTSVTPGSYTIEIADFNDILTSNAERRINRSDVDFYLVIITTPAEAERLVKTTMSADPTSVTPQMPIVVEVATTDVVVVPPTLTPSDSNTLEGPQVNAVANKSGANVTNLSVTAGNKSLTLTPNVMATKAAVPQVQISLTPGSKSCTTAAGKSCTITGLSPWLTYSATGVISGDTSGASTSGLRTSLELKAGSKVNVASLGLASAAKAVKATVAKKSLRATGSCSLNAAQTVLTVGKTGSCSISVRTTKKVQKKDLAGPSLSLRAVIK